MDDNESKVIPALAAIALGAAFVFRHLGVPGTKTENRSYVKIRWISTTLILLVLSLSILLGYRMADRLAVGQIRPMSFRVSTTVKEIVNERVDQIGGLNVISLGRSGSGQSKLVRIILNADKPIQQSVIDHVKDGVKEVLGDDTPVVIAVFQNAIIE